MPCSLPPIRRFDVGVEALWIAHSYMYLHRDSNVTYAQNEERGRTEKAVIGSFAGNLGEAPACPDDRRQIDVHAQVKFAHDPIPGSGQG
jgi:hypothetical protein